MTQKKQKKSNETKQSKNKSMTQSQRLKLGAVLILIAIAAFFIIKYLTKDNVHTDEFYTFTKEGELTFTDSLGNVKAKIDLEIADNDFDRQLGLMSRKSMKENQGMLFIFPFERPQSFWMRNTLISLDMIFVNKNRQIVTIHKNTKVLSDQSYPSSKPAMYVVEVNAGFTDKYNIVVGDRIYWMSTKL
ncbi:hypothetical protein BMS3Abin03_03202 [bacterium BMS3Abin03]|nr:hypothetical protein BMS3Abin03_03202 [bacterium BMS3Abin03]